MKPLTLDQYKAKIKNRLSKKYTPEELVYIVDKRSEFIKVMFEGDVSYVEICKMLTRIN